MLSVQQKCLTNEEEEAGGDKEQRDKRENTISILGRCTHLGMWVPLLGITNVVAWKPVKCETEFFIHWSGLTVSEGFSMSG